MKDPYAIVSDQAAEQARGVSRAGKRIRWLSIVMNLLSMTAYFLLGKQPIVILYQELKKNYILYHSTLFSTI